MKKSHIFINLKNKIKRKKNIVGIMGLGYVGLPLAMAFSLSKIKTIGYDINKKRVALLKRKKSYLSSVSDDIIRKTYKNFDTTSNVETVKIRCNNNLCSYSN